MKAAVVLRFNSGNVIVTFPYDRWVVDSLKARIPSDERSYDPSSKSWWITAPWAATATDVLQSAFDHVRFESEQPSWSDRTPKPPQQAGDYATLHLLPTAPPELIQAAYRTLALLHHPDRGGDVRMMQTVNAAYAALAASEVA